MNLIKKLLLLQTQSRFSYPGKISCQCGSYFCEILGKIRDGFWCAGKICFFLLFMIALLIATPDYGFSYDDLFPNDVLVTGKFVFPICGVLIWIMKVIKRAAADGDVRLPYECIIGYIMGFMIFYFWGAAAIAQISGDGTWLLLRLYLYPYVGMSVIQIAAGIWHDQLVKSEFIDTIKEVTNEADSQNDLSGEKPIG